MVAASSRPHQFAGLFSPTQKQQAGPLWTRGKHASLKKTPKKNHPALALSLWWLNFLTSFQKALKCLEARGRNKLMVDGEHWTNFRALSCLAFEVESELLPFNFQSPPSSCSVTEGFEKKVIVLTAILIRAHAPALVFQELSPPL